MRIVCDEMLSPGWLVGRIHPPQLGATFFIKATFKLNSDGNPEVWPDEPELVSGDVHVDDDNAKSLWYASDFAPFKPYADVLLQATAYAPGGRPVSELIVGFGIGQYRKELVVLGNRRWDKHLVGLPYGEPQPFTAIPVTYENAFGGVDYKINPVGKGRSTTDLPNIELPGQRLKSPTESLPPAGFGPLTGSWAQRRSLVGNYDNDWLKYRWPWYPKDFDWRYFNAAPMDQQFKGYLRGDEALYFKNMHPKIQLYRSQLPGIRARCFLDERPANTAEQQKMFREVQMNLDTLWIDLNAEKLILVWRGITTVRSIRLNEIEHLFMFCESLSTGYQELPFYQGLLEERLHSGEDAKVSDESTIDSEDEADKAAIAAQLLEMEKAFSQARDEEKMALAAAKDQLSQAGLDPTLADRELSQKTIAETRAALAVEIDQLKSKFPVSTKELAELEVELAQLEELEALEADFERLQAEDDELTRDQVEAGAIKGESFAGKDLEGLDLSRLNLAGLNFEKANLRKCNLANTSLAGANLTRAELTDTDLSYANLSNSLLDRADLTGAKLENTSLLKTSLNGTILSELDLKDLDLSGCYGEGADFSNSNLSGTQFSGAVLAKADFCGCVLNEAVFSRADLKAAQFEEVKALQINMIDADITGLHASDGSIFSGGVFLRAKAVGSNWEEAVLDDADFSQADLTGSLFTEASLKRTVFDRAHLAFALFDDANLSEAQLTNANLLRATFDRAILTDTSMTGANLYECSFCETLIERIDVRGANLKGTQLG